jgi:8-oxo-dGTP pyrophosphatase MutT (NUDIX family)
MATEGKIRVIVLAAILRPGDHALLVFRGFDPSKTQHFYRPLGGGVEFGESSEQALQREMMEELGVAVRTLRKLGTLENLFVYDGCVGHELVIVWLAEFLDPALYREAVLPYIEGDEQNVAEWMQPATLRAQGIPLYPDGLAELLQEV